MNLSNRRRAYVIALVLAPTLLSNSALDSRAERETLTFQTHKPWAARIHLDADIAMVYGIDPSLPERMASWRAHGYRIQVMTGVAWGQYQDYLNGQFDGENHWDEAQTDRDGKKILHGGSKDIPYIAPGIEYGRYLTVGVQRALDAGAEAIYLEEPEFWARAGWSRSFRREWQAKYGEAWQAPDSSPDAQYRASQLKYFLYRRALEQVFSFVRAYSREHRRDIRCYVPTHSLINYAHWRIVSPESSLIDVGAESYIAQVWTGTARTPNVYEGRTSERTFETAYLEYSAMQNLVRASGRRVWYLNDPIEDDPNHSWSDYRRNWQSTLIASLLQPEVWRYEIMPWPERIFNGKYPAREVPPSKPQRRSSPIGTGLDGFGPAPAVERIGIPQPYATELQAVIRALGEMHQPANTIRWARSGTHGVGVLVSDTMMFQRADPSPSDSNLGSFYGLAMPLIKHGVPVEPVQIESAAKPGFLSRNRVLLLTYEGQKPPAPELHLALSRWVRAGGSLVIVDDDQDPYNRVREWWNQPPLHYKTPREHLFQILGLPLDATGLHRVGRGIVLREKASPAAWTYQPDGANRLLTLVRTAAAAVGVSWHESNALVLRRGPYVVTSALDESAAPSGPDTLKGTFINLFDPDLPLIDNFQLSPGSRALLFDIHTRPTSFPRVLAAACRVRNERYQGGTLHFDASGIGDTQAVVRIATNSPPTAVLVGGQLLPADHYDFDRNTVRLRFANSVEPQLVEVRFSR